MKRIKHKITKEDFIEMAIKLYGEDRFDFSDMAYKTSKDSVKIRCNNCGSLIDITPYELLKRKHNPCKICYRMECNAIKSKKFIERSIKKFGEDSFEYSNLEYSSVLKRVNLHCNKCGNDIMIYPLCHLKSKTGCTVCSGSIVTNEEFKKRSVSIYGSNAYTYFDDYVNMHSIIKLKCNNCGYIFSVEAQNHLSHNSGCPKCRKKKFALEENVKAILDKLKIKYKVYQTFEWLHTVSRGYQTLDFYLVDYNSAIECQGIGHFKPIDFAGRGSEWAKETFLKSIERDKRKKRLCEENGVRLFYVNYDDNAETRINEIISSLK